MYSLFIIYEQTRSVLGTIIMYGLLIFDIKVMLLEAYIYIYFIALYFMRYTDPDYLFRIFFL